MDWLTRLSGSPAPNAFAVVCMVVLTVVAFVMRQRAAGVRFGLVTLALGVAIGAKNAAYSTIVSAPHHENDLAARHDFARVLMFVVIAQIVLGVIVIVNGDSIKLLRWLGVTALVAICLAAASMLDWHAAYLHQDVNQPIHYELTTPWVQCVLLVGLVIAVVMALASFVRRPQSRH